jgi:ABC-type dipeptide/oligopeptide/nickel transport system permease component
MSIRYVGQRLALAVPVLLTVFSLVFFVVRVLPGDPAQAALGDNASQQAVDALRTQLGLDAPIGTQYLRFLGSLLHGDLGTSMINGQPVRDLIAYNLPFTLELAAVALGIGIAIGVPLGMLGAVRRNRATDYVVRIGSLVGVCVPAFFVGIVLMLVFGVVLGWLPTIGGGASGSVADITGHLVLPSVALGLVMTGSITRLARTAMVSVIDEDYVQTARAKGLTERVVLFVHSLRPALLPILSLTGVWSVVLVGDSVTTEVVFARPGLGKMMVGAVLQRDYTTLQSVMVVYTVLVVGLNLLTELAYGLVDPRTRV